MLSFSFMRVACPFDGIRAETSKGAPAELREKLSSGDFADDKPLCFEVRRGVHQKVENVQGRKEAFQVFEVHGSNFFLLLR